MNLVKSSTPNKWTGGNTCQVIVIHWWDRPEKKPTLQGVVSHFQDPDVEVSAHYVVSDDTVVQMCEETDRAWHAVAANGFSIGIEVDPNTPGDTYKTLGELVRGIRSRHGNIPLRRHSDYVLTECPGIIDLNRINAEANEEDMGKPVDLGGLNIMTQLAYGRDSLPTEQKAFVGQDWQYVLWQIATAQERKAYLAARKTEGDFYAAHKNEKQSGDPKLDALGKALKDFVS